MLYGLSFQIRLLITTFYFHIFKRCLVNAYQYEIYHTKLLPFTVVCYPHYVEGPLIDGTGLHDLLKISS
jgi:hypothetical protein